MADIGPAKDISIPGGLMFGQGSVYARLRAEHEAHYTEFGPPGRPYQFHPYPTHMYRAGRNEMGKIVILEGKVADNDHERSNLESMGFTHGGQGAAIAAWEKREQDMAIAAAEINYDIRKMSAGAKAEAEAAMEAAPNHLDVIPETPIKRPVSKPSGWVSQK